MATVTTLPATFVSGAVLTAAQQNDLRGAFRVLQVVVGTTSTNVSNSTSTFENTLLTATITPSSTSSKILVYVVHTSCHKTAGNATNRMDMRLQRNAVDVLIIGSDLGFTEIAQRSLFTVSSTFFDSPASVAALTYKTVFNSTGNTAAMSVQESGASTITLMEISA